jgi:hypothetical protein
VPVDFTALVRERLHHHVEVVPVGLAVSHELDGPVAFDDAFAAKRTVVPFDDPLFAQLGHGVLEPLSDPKGSADDLLPRAVRERDAMFRAFEQRDRKRRLLEHVAQLLALDLGALAELCELHVQRDARDELACRERLHDVVVGARFDALHARLFARARRQHDDRDRTRLFVFAKLVEQREAVELGHHDIREDERGRISACGLERLASVRDGVNAESRRERARDVLAHVGVVVGEENRRAVGRALVVRRGEPTRCFLDVARARATLAARRACGGEVFSRSRNGDDERRPRADFARHRHVAAMDLGELLHEREPDARPFVASRAPALHAMKSIEDAR